MKGEKEEREEDEYDSEEGGLEPVTDSDEEEEE